MSEGFEKKLFDMMFAVGSKVASLEIIECCISMLEDSWFEGNKPIHDIVNSCVWTIYSVGESSRQPRDKARGSNKLYLNETAARSRPPVATPRFRIVPEYFLIK